MPLVEKFLKRLLLSGLLFSALQSLSQSQIGVQLYTFRHHIPKDVPGMLEKISQMGIRELEGGGTYGLPVDSFKMLLKKNNLVMVSIGSGFNELDSNAKAAVERAKPSVLRL